MVIDSGVDISHLEIRNHVNIANWEKEEYIDVVNHGTHIAGIVLNGTCDQVELVSCKYYSGHTAIKDNYYKCLDFAIRENFDVINMSLGGDGNNLREYASLFKIVSKGTIVVTAAGNENKDLSKNCDYFPACYKLDGLVRVGNLGINNKRHESSNYGLSDMRWEPGEKVLSTIPANAYDTMTGTSQSAAKYTNKILKELCKVN